MSRLCLALALCASFAAAEAKILVRAVEEGLARDVGRIVRRAWTRLGPIYGATTPPERRIRVYVFETRKDYLAYAARHRPRWRGSADRPCRSS